ncbi:rRNA maturation RNase YbeY [Roseisolibacter sp. H3M3-2]|uniref:rRNA maturation RNase YbeY n=1 Tax=Roseisolibacter sp. H3M3-2 TaxID=3031323 RepID=UPI0023DC2832|nr:rRNA maturation RNase YbeY [Roseisolibacter sp. H3M3-2]MDF1502170.1 rRNA maturation RNase YbeY [Roseisolibacter sp. H3M3-2]
MTGAGDSRRRARAGEAIRVTVAARGTRAALRHDDVAALAARVLRAEGTRAADVSVTFLAPTEMARLNREHLGHRGPTDVITFALAPVPGAPLTGDVYVCPAVAREHAAAHGVSVAEETARLVVHAMLHVIGHEHPEDEGRTDSEMWRRQERYLRRFYGTGGGAA